MFGREAKATVQSACTRLLAPENTFGGQVRPGTIRSRPRPWPGRHGLATRLDGARLFDAAVTTVDKDGDAWAEARRITGLYDTASVCFNKGPGAPVASALVGPADIVAVARRSRQMLGGGLRQAGVLAAAALHALDHHLMRLADDHARASTWTMPAPRARFRPSRACWRRADGPGMALQRPSAAHGVNDFLACAKSSAHRSSPSQTRSAAHSRRR